MYVGKAKPKHQMSLTGLLARADDGDADAMESLGDMYYLGHGQKVPKDVDKAMHWYRKAAHLNNRNAMPKLAELLRPKDLDGAKYWYQKASDLGCASASNSLGVIHRKAKDFTRAVELFIKASVAGCALAGLNLGRMHEKGDGVPSNMDLAVRWYAQAANKGSALAMYHVGRLADDPDVAIHWFHKAANDGEPKAMCQLGDHHHYKTKDFALALKWYHKAAAQGSWYASGLIALMHSKGLGVPQDFALAAQWYRKAATSSDVPDDKVALLLAAAVHNDDYSTNKRPAEPDTEGQPESKKPFHSPLIGFQGLRKVRDDGLCFWRSVLERTRTKLHMSDKLDFIYGTGDDEIAAIDMLRRSYANILHHHKSIGQMHKIERAMKEYRAPAIEWDAWSKKMETPVRVLQAEGNGGELADPAVGVLTPLLFETMGIIIELHIDDLHILPSGPTPPGLDVTVIKLHRTPSQHGNYPHYDLIL
jgi:TPR repeat protein